jgi:serine/threonine-protein kinase
MTEAGSRLAAALSDRYRIDRELGQGGMATVYLAHDLKHDRKVALKVLKPELAAVLGAERFVVEIRTTASLQHPHILPLFDSGTADGFLYYVMPFIEGETIREKLNRETQLGVDEAVRIAREVADALDYAHRRGVIHRDIKPENILLVDGRPMVADFGIALAVSAAAGGRMTETGLSLGTPHYMSPEQATADKDITARSDVYSLASVLYEALAGEPPHTAGSAQAVIMKIITDVPRPVQELRRNVPPNVAAALAKALEKLPADRFASAKDFGDALGNASFVSANTVAASPRMSAARRAVPMPVFVASSGVLLIAALAAAAWGLRRPEPAPQIRTRFTLELPDSQAAIATYGQRNLAISPDGTELVYAGVGRSGMVLYRRRLDELAQTEVAGSTYPLNVRFSPDGRYLLLERQGSRSLTKTPLAGGASVQLAERAGSASWDEGDFIVFASEDGALWRVNENGGTPAPLATPDSVMFHGFPHVLPGGKAVLYNAGSRRSSGGSGGRAQVWVLRLGDGSRARLNIDGLNPRYIPTGHILVSGPDGTVLAAPFDLASLELRGAPVQVMDGVLATSTGANKFDVSETGVLTYFEGLRMFTPAVIDRQGSERLLGFPMARDRHPRFSPNGDRIAVERSNGNSTDIYVLTRGTGQVLRLTRDGRSRSPEWSGDGSRIVWIREDTSGATTMHWQRADGSGTPEQVAMPDGNLHRFHVAPAGDAVALAIGPAVRHDIVLAPLGGSSPLKRVATSPADEVQPAISPDGKWLAYASNETDGRYEVYIASVADPATRIQVSTEGANAPVWKADSKTLIFSTTSHFVSATFTFSPRIEVARRDTLFVNAYRAGAVDRVFDFNPKTGEFLVLSTGTGVRARIVVVTGWFEDLKERMAQVPKQ